MNRFITSSLLIALGVALLPSCGDDKSAVSDQNVSVTVNRMTSGETNVLFQRRGRYITRGKNGFVGLRVAVENHGNQPCVVAPALNAITDAQTLYKKVERNIAGITTCATLGGLLFGGPVGAIACGVGFGVTDARKNEMLLDEVHQDVFLGPQEVLPKATLNKIMFVRKSDLQNEFSLPIDSYQHHVAIA